MDAKIEAQAAESDPTARAQILGEIQAGLAADVPYVPLWQTNQQVVFKPTVSGIVLDPVQFFRYFTISVSGRKNPETFSPISTWEISGASVGARFNRVPEGLCDHPGGPDVPQSGVPPVLHIHLPTVRS